VPAGDWPPVALWYHTYGRSEGVLEYSHGALVEATDTTIHCGAVVAVVLQPQAEIGAVK